LGQLTRPDYSTKMICRPNLASYGPGKDPIEM
jgi:hypothetical protein